MLPFLSCSLTSLVAQACRLAGGVDDDELLGVELLPVELVGVELLDDEGREELPELLELLDGVELLDRSSLRRSSLRRPSSPRDRLLRQSGRPPLRSPYRLRRSRSRRSSGFPPSDRELPLGGWAKARCDGS
jgi:hypothetical protein